MSGKTTEIERMFARLDERMAQVDAAIARVQALTAAMNARLLAVEEHTAVEVQAAAESLDDLGERLGRLEARGESRQNWPTTLAITADENGEYPGAVEAAAGSIPWTMSDDETTWRAQLPDGRTAVIERLDDGESFLPKVYESSADFATGPVCAGVLDAAAWVWDFAGTR
jgi:hypothetical protein